MDRDELIAAIRRLRNADGTAEEQDELLDGLMTLLPASGISDLIYWTELPPEEAADRALSKRPIEL